MPDNNALGGLVGTILSQHTSDINSGRAYERLVQAFPTWEAVRDSPTYEVAEAIRCGGLANIKSVRIQDVLHTLTEQQQDDGYMGSLSDYLYEKLTERSPEEAWHYLRRLPGVGPKTAACVLLFNLGQALMPVDTHVHRVSKRLGLIGPRVSADQAHDIFTSITPPEWTHTLHVDLIRHGRQVCHAQHPNCLRCSLFMECAYAGRIDNEKTSEM